MSFAKSLLGMAAATLLAFPAQAGLIGDTVGTRYLATDGLNVFRSSVVGAGEEGNFFSTTTPNQFFDYGDNSFRIRSAASFIDGIISGVNTVSLELTSLDLGAPITSVSFSTNLTGVTEVHTGTSVTFSWLEQAITPTVYLSATFNTSNVPEPATFAMLGAGLIGLAATRRVSRQNVA